MYKKFGAAKQDTWAIVAQMAIEMCRDTDPYVAMHGDIWIDQSMTTISLFNDSETTTVIQHT